MSLLRRVARARVVQAGVSAVVTLLLVVSTLFVYFALAPNLTPFRYAGF